MEESELGREGLADGLRIGAEGLDPTSSRVKDGDEMRHAFQDGLVRLGFGSEDGHEMAPVVDEEEPIADSCRGAGGAVRMQDPKNDSMKLTSALTSSEYWAKVLCTGKLIIGKLSEFIGILTANCCTAILRPFQRCLWS